MNKPFDQFIGKYSLSKTLRFELKPTPQTEELLKKVNLQGKTPVQVDQEIDELYNKEMKPMFDSLHEQFIDESLENVDFKITDLENFERNYLALKKLSKDKKSNANEIKKLTDPKNEEIPKLQSRLRDVVVVQFNETAKKWKGTLDELETEMYNKNGKKKIKIDIKAETPALLKEENVLAILAHFNPDKIAQIKRFQGFFTYFSGFNINRENYYTSKAQTTGVANRIVNTNLPIFLDNKQKFEEINEKIPALKEYERFFKLENYKNCLTQKSIDDFNEDIRGKINAEKNLFCQQENTNIRDQKNKVSLPNLKKLQKQIGCKTKQQREQEEKGESIHPKYLEKIGLGFQITQDAQGKYQVWKALEYLTEELRPKMEKIKENYQNFFDSWKDYKLDEIWFRKEAINTISGRWFGGENWDIITKALKYTGTGKLEKGEYKVPPFVSLQDLKEAMEALECGVDFDVKKSKRKIKTDPNNEATKKFSYSAVNLFKDDYKAHYKESLFETLMAVWQSEVDFKFKQIFDGYKNEQGKDVRAFLKEFEENKNTPFDKNKKDGEKSIHIEIVKNLVEEGYLRLFQLTKYHNLEKKGEIDPRQTENKFYDALNEFWEENKIVIYHKAFQATLTKKPYSEDKIKLNFECGTLLDGWSQDYESFGALIFQKGSKFYLGIIKGTKFSTDEVSGLYQDITIGNEANRLVYLVQKIDRKNPPRWFIRSKGTSFSPMVREGLLNPSEILDIYDRKLYSKTENKETYKAYLPKLLDYFKDGFRKHKDFAGFKSEFNWFDSKEYNTVADFYDHTADMCYKISWEKINFEALNKLVKQNRIYLFQIYNKDFELDENIGKNKYGIGFKAEETTGIHNSHTQLFVELLKPKNVKKLKLLGGGELFFRNPSKEKRYKKDKRGREVLDAKRYYEQKYFLHFPIEIKGSERNLKNSFVNQKVVDEQDKIKIIGIDRGEKNLLYYSVLDSNGIMIDQGSLNKIEVKQPIEEKEVKTEYENGEIKNVELINMGCKVNYVDYQVLLDYYEKKRILARRSWQVIGKIKDLKEGYLSQAVHKIYRLIIQHNALVVMEDLNSEFKAKRTAKVEKSVYKNFEIALAKKLNHLILKDKNPDELGGVLNGYQLTPKIEVGKVGDFEKARQWGILFYVPPHYTSTTDPLTGWRKHKRNYISNSETVETIQKFFNPDTGVKIEYDQSKQCFKFAYDNDGKAWELFAFDGLQRFRWDSKDRKVKTYNLYEEFENLFAGLDKSKNLNQQIYGKDFKWKDLVFFWNLLNQIRNTDKSKTGNENDFLQSPVWSAKHQQFFNSRKITVKNLPDNGDANGAYNIARKGAMLLKRIKKHTVEVKQFLQKYQNNSNYTFSEDKSGNYTAVSKQNKDDEYRIHKTRPDLSISNADWDNAAQDWENYVKNNK